MRVRALGAASVLSLVGVVLLALGSGRHAQKPTAHGLRSPNFSSQSSQRTPEARAILGQLPLSFEPNRGQADPRVKFLARGAGYGLFLDESGATLSIPSSASSQVARSEQIVRMKLVGVNPAAAISSADPLPGKTNYLIGNDPNKWHSRIPQFAAVHYANVYPGIDLVFYGNEGRLEYDFRVGPGADPSQAELQFDGAGKLELRDGDLILAGSSNQNSGVRLRAPQIYQLDHGRRTPVAGRFVLRAANRVAFEVGPYDHSRELVIDPILEFSTYFGGNGAVTSPSVAVNGDGFIYIVGSTTSSGGFPLTGTQIGPNPHIFVAKIDPAQPSGVVYLTFLGGSGTDTSAGIGVDNGGDVFFAGTTSSSDFPHAGSPYQTGPEVKGSQCSGITCTSVFVGVLTGLDPTGATLTYSTYLSGTGNDQASAMAIDAKGDVFVTGTTTSTDTPTLTDAFPATLTPSPYQASPNPGSTIQFFVTEVNTNAVSVGGIAYSTYFGGGTPTPAIAIGGGIAVDANSNIYFSGTTNFYNSGLGQYGNSGQSEDFPILNAYQPCLDTPPPTVLSNSNACSNTGFASPFPTDAFVAKINPLGQPGTQLLFSTYLGGAGTDSGTALAIDSGAANIYLTGSTNSSDFVIPVGTVPFQLCLNNPGLNSCTGITPSSNTDAYVARFGNPALSTTGTPNFVPLTYFSYLGGSGNDSGLAIAVDSTTTSDTLNDAIVTGATSSTNFPVTVGAIQSTLGTGATQNAFFAHIDTTTTTSLNEAGDFVTYFGGSGSDRGTGVAVDPFLNSYFVGDTTSNNLQVDNPLPGETTLTGSSDAFIVQLGPANDLSVTSVAPVLSPAGLVWAGNQVTITFTVSNQGLDPATGISVTGAVPDGVMFNSATAGTGTCAAPSNNQVVCTIPTLQAGSTAPVNFVVTPNSKGSYSATITVVNVNNTTKPVIGSAPFQATDFLMTVNPPSQVIAAGQIATYSVQVNPDPVFSANVSLTCSGLPSGASFSFTDATVTPNGSSVSSVLKITTTAQPVTTVASGWRRPFYGLWLIIPGMAWLGLGVGRKRRRRTTRLIGLLMLSVLFGLVLLQPACGGNSTPPPVSGTPSGNSQLKVTATSGSFTQSQVVQLTVTP